MVDFQQGNSSNLTSSESSCTATAEKVLTYIRLIFYGVVFLFGTVGNILVIFAYRNPRMRTVTNLFIANLGVADLTVSLINVPVSMSISILPYWPFGLILCKSIPYLLGVTIFSSVGTLVAIATDRYRAIVHPLLPRIRTRHAIMMIAGIWSFASIYPVPLIIYNKLTVEKRCNEEWPSKTAPKTYTVMVAVVLYLIPLIAISVLYYLISHNLSTSESPAQAGARRANRSVIRMLVIVVILFAACWLPFHIVFLYINFVGEPDLNLVYFSLWLMYANSACNPIVYAVFNRNYRREFIRLLRCQSLAVSRYIHCDSFNDRHKGFSVESTSVRGTKTVTRISLKRKGNARDDFAVSETVGLNGVKTAITDIPREKSFQVDGCSGLIQTSREDKPRLSYETGC